MEAAIEIIRDLWLFNILSTYHKESIGFLTNESDRFLNPVGHSYKDSISQILEEIFGSFSELKIKEAMGMMAKIGCLSGYSFENENFTFFLQKVLKEKKELVGAELTEKIEERLAKLYMLEKKIFEETQKKLEELKKRGFFTGMKRKRVG
ncbi:MAG: hypothetical protein RMJ39_00945 [Deltaproteobacteria bacterium]|nr:hypothetical protein [Deltaproteobacteria bacterium]